VIIDLHTHPRGFVPQPYRTLWKGVTPLRPRETGFDALGAGGVDATVAVAVGDPIITRRYRGLTPWQAVDRQLTLIETEASAAGAVIARSVDDMVEAKAQGRPAVVLGVEGADALGGDVGGLETWQAQGVRLVVLVHLGDNSVGTTCMPWQRYAAPYPARRRAEHGLTPFGRRVVTEMNRLAMLVDVAHADRTTCLDVAGHALAPVVSSHSGARAVQDFPRYLADNELRAIAATGGVIGLWPYRSTRHGVRTIDDLVAHARHIASVVGVDHLALGTDMNGVPRVMSGYRGERDVPVVIDALQHGGFTAAEVEAIAGGNALRVLQAVEAAAT
jgi:membrane dipeptidase